LTPQIKYYLIKILLIAMLCSGCEQDKEPPKEKIARMYVDILIAEQTYMFDADSQSIAIDQVYVKYGISKENYAHEIRKFETDEEEWSEFFTLAENYLDSLKSMGHPPES
jgi:hypothetical protein